MNRLFFKPGPQLLSAALCLAASSPVLAQDVWEAGLSLQTEYTDNAGRGLGEGQSERQDEAELDLGASYENQLLDLSAGYRARARHFDEGSQEDRTTLEGDSRVLFGKPHHPVDLLISHSRRTQLNEPDDVDLLRNTDERDLFTVAPSARWRFGGADTLVATGQASRVEYRRQSERDSERLGGSLAWRRSLSETDQLSLTGRQMEVEFEAAPWADYRYNAYLLGYQVELRRLSYQIQGGYNDSEPRIGEGMSGATYLINLQYDSGLSRWTLDAEQRITDNSMESGSGGELGGFNPGGSSAGDRDQIERRELTLAWVYDGLCQRCSLDISLIYQTDDYLTLDENREERGAQAGLNYSLSRRASLDLSWQKRDSEFEENVNRSDFSRERWRLRYRYQWRDDVNINLFAAYNQRDTRGGLTSYEENRGGLGLTYSF